jgi:coiled-coil domain-containing protein 61
MGRYVILTYTGEFDRVHYPLPLAFEDRPNPQALQRRIKRLRLQLKTQAQDMDTPNSHKERELRVMVAQLRQDNTELRHRLRHRANTSTTSDQGSGDVAELLESNQKLRRQLESLNKQLIQASKALDAQKLEADKEIARYKALYAQAQAQSSGGAGGTRARSVSKEARQIVELQQSLQRLQQALRL